MRSAIPIPYPITRIEPHPVAYTTHAVLIAAVAVRSWSPTAGDRPPSIDCTKALTALHANTSVISSHSGVSAIKPARCNHGIASIAAGPAVKIRMEAPISPRAR